MGSIGKRAVALILCLAAALGVTASPAMAGWTTTQLAGEAGTMFLLGVSCPEAGFCVASGSQNLIASSTDPTGGAGAWHVVYAGEGPLSQPAHPSPPGVEPQGPVPSSSQLRGISCPSTHLCVAVTNLGVVYSSTDPTGPASAWSVAELSPTGRNIHLSGVSCPTESLCVAVSGRRESMGKVFTSTDPTGGVAAWQEADLGEALDLRAVSCASATLCVAAGANGELVASTDPTGGPGAWRVVGSPGGAGVLQSIACVPGACLTGNSGGKLLTATEPTALSSWHEASGGGSVQITGGACATASACLAVDNNGDVIVSGEATGAHPGWSLTNLRPYDESVESGNSALGNALFGAACPSLDLCVLVGSRGAILTGTEPFAVAPTGTPASRAARGRRPGSGADRSGRGRGSSTSSSTPRAGGGGSASRAGRSC